MKRGYMHLFPIISILLSVSAAAYGQPWAGILAQDRAIDWDQVGIPGGIPGRTTVCANLTAGASTASIQSAINSCPAGQVVSFGAGTFNLTTDIYTNKGVVLRGQGPNATTLALNGNIMLGTSGDGHLGNTPSTPGWTTWTGGLTRGSTVLTVGSTANMVAGQIVIIDELNPSWVFPDSGVAGPCTSGNSCGRNDSPLGWFGSSDRALPQMVEIVSIDSATQLTIKDPVGYTHTAGLSPQVMFWSHNGTKGSIKRAGIENMKIDANSNDFAISFVFCDYCWVKNVWVTDPSRASVSFRWSYGGIVRDSYFESTLGGAPEQYGIETFASSNMLVENNICFNVTACVLPESSYGQVTAYNYGDNKVAGNLFATFTAHLSHNAFQLVEGNVMNTITYDNSWGSASHSTIFRNRAWGNGTNKTNYRVAIKLNARQRFMNVVGNVAGDPSLHTQYLCDDTHRQGSDNFVFEVGFMDNCDSGTTNYDTVTGSSAMRWGNWDAVTWKANGNSNGVRYCTGSGEGNPSCTGSETASTDPTFPGLPSPSTTLPASLYRDSKPSWFGNTSWPPIGPDVTCSQNCIANTANHAAMIPAQMCYANSQKNSGGYLTAFDGAACYGADSGSGTPGIKPSPPTALSIL